MGLYLNFLSSSFRIFYAFFYYTRTKLWILQFESTLFVNVWLASIWGERNWLFEASIDGSGEHTPYDCYLLKFIKSMILFFTFIFSMFFNLKFIWVIDLFTFKFYLYSLSNICFLLSWFFSSIFLRVRYFLLNSSWSKYP